MLKFNIQQIALNIPNPKTAQAFLSKIGLDEWFLDHVVASGIVFDNVGSNEADLRFNYQAGTGADEGAAKPLELEILDYTTGPNWLDDGARPDECVSHLGMHVTGEELLKWRAFFQNEGVAVAQEVLTESHTNPAIAGKRKYNYVIFDTHHIIGVDLKFIVRIDL